MFSKPLLTNNWPLKQGCPLDVFPATKDSKFSEKLSFCKVVEFSGKILEFTA